MDLSQEYILMCQKALPYLPLPKELNAQWLVWNNPVDFIHLWTQDQLQEMVNKYSHWYLLHRDFNYFVESLDSMCQTDVDNRSMEQLWLAFVMWTLYQKKWSGKEWVNE